MTVSLKHTKVSAIADNPAAVSAGEVVPSDWNAEHTLTMASARLLGRTTAGVGAAEEISIGAGLSLSGGVLTGTASTPPGGVSTTVQYNNGSGGFAGDAGFTWDNSLKRLNISGASNGIFLQGTDPYTGLHAGWQGLGFVASVAAGGWARGMVAIKNSDGTGMAGAGFLGTNESLNLWRFGVGSSWWDPASAVNGFSVDSAGNAELSTGAVPTSWNTDFRALEIGQKGSGIWNARNASNLWITANAYYNSSAQFIYANNGGAWGMNIGPGNDQFTIRRAASGTAGNVISWSTLFSIDSAGLISNGVTDSGTATARFQKNGASAYGKTVLVSCTGGTDGPQIWYRRDGVSEWGVGMLSGTNDFGFQWGGNHATFGTTHMYLGSGGGMVLSNGTFTAIKSAGGSDYTNYNIEVRTATGDAGIGFHNGGANASTLIYSRSSGLFEFRNNPISSYQSVKMQDLYMNGGLLITVNGGANSYSALTLRGEKNGYGGINFQRNDGTYLGTMMFGTDRAYWGLYDEARGVWPLYTPSWTSTTKTWYFEGGLYASQNITAYSDARVKKNVKTLDNALADVLRMRGVSYDRIDTETSSIGVIAQELREVAPVLVHEGEKGELSVAYGNLAGFFIEAIKELAARVKHLEALVEG